MGREKEIVHLVVDRTERVTAIRRVVCGRTRLCNDRNGARIGITGAHTHIGPFEDLIAHCKAGKRIFLIVLRDPLTAIKQVYGFALNPKIRLHVDRAVQIKGLVELGIGTPQSTDGCFALMSKVLG